MDFLVIFILVLSTFGLYFIGMGIRMVLKKGLFRAGCTSEVHIPHENVLDCGVCPKKEVNLCESRDDMGLAGISSMSAMGRFDKDSDDTLSSSDKKNT